MDVIGSFFEIEEQKNRNVFLEMKYILDFEFSPHALITDGLFWVGDVCCIPISGVLTSIPRLLSGLTSTGAAGNGRGSVLDTGGGGRGRPVLCGGTSTTLEHKYYLYYFLLHIIIFYCFGVHAACLHFKTTRCKLRYM